MLTSSKYMLLHIFYGVIKHLGLAIKKYVLRVQKSVHPKGAL